MFSRRKVAAASPQEPWGRSRLLLMLAAAATTVTALLLGLGLAIRAAWGNDVAATVPSSITTDAPQVSVRDRIADQPMASVPTSAAFTPDAAAQPAATIAVPAATIDLGSADVPTGFPRTPAGALGQLAAIEKLVLESMSMPTTRQVHAAWVLPGGPRFEEWPLTGSVSSFLNGAQQSGTEKDLDTIVEVNPAAGLVKGVDGPDWVVACVLIDVRVAIRAQMRAGYGLCQRMQWADGRWQIASGANPAQAPSTWPGSQAALDAGWLTWAEKGR